MKELSSKYDHKKTEAGRYNWWVENGFFNSGDKTKEPFTIVIPPPNVTGKLHLGHAWDNTLQDIIIRRKRMQGYDALFLPGMDHAGIATQAKVDAKLKTLGTNRYELGREKFLEVAWDWKKEYANTIKEQWAKIGISVDYNKERFTLDKGLNDAVNKVFIDLYNKGYIYQGKRIINWDPQAKTALSNIEVEYKETAGAFYHLVYKFVGEDKGVVIATTRPETLFADTALMVNPHDAEHKYLIGKKVIVPTTERVIPIIADEHVEIGFGTGIVKVTPAHDPNDYEVGIRHNLEMPSCMNDDGTMNEMANKYCGLDRFACRKKLIADLIASKECIKVEKVNHNVGYSERTGVQVEPRLSKQWFVKMDKLAKNALDNQKTNNRVNFVPERFEKIFTNWMTGVYDWCISRQLWWGHRIPAWYKGDLVKVQVESPGEDWVQDEDVLDTWFSSALWPFSSLGWPNNLDGDYKRYYPTNVLVTGYDIIFFWVSRMIFQALEFTKKRPFKDVLIHGLIRDSIGRKMSKSLGNGVDPMDIVDKYGSDSMRYYLATNSSPGLDLRYSEQKIAASWNYINKIWNISRYIFMNVTEVEEITFDNLDLISKWILSELSKTIEIADKNYDNYEFGEAARAIYNFTWNTFANWYVEMSKVSLNDEKTNRQTGSVLVYCLESIIKLLHPFMPFVTEEIYQSLPSKNAPSIVVSKWPVARYFDKESNKVNTLIEIVTAVRNVRNEKKVKLSKPIGLSLICDNDKMISTLNSMQDYIVNFCNLDNCFITKEKVINKNDITVIIKGVTISIPLKGLVNLDEERTRLQGELTRLKKEIARGEKMLANENFIAKAPIKKVNSEKEKLASYKLQYQKTEAAMAELD